ncbi:hypothetical protein D3C71_1642450 [compost metagenome]
MLKRMTERYELLQILKRNAEHFLGIHNPAQIGYVIGCIQPRTLLAPVRRIQQPDFFVIADRPFSQPGLLSDLFNFQPVHASLLDFYS